MELLGRVTFDEVDEALELNLGGDYDNFSLECGGKYNSTDTTLQISNGVASADGEWQHAMFFSSNGSTNTSGLDPTCIVRLKKYVSSAWVTVLHVEFVEKTLTGAVFNVITANADYPVTIKGSPAA